MPTLFGWPDKAPVHEYRKKRDGLREDSESSSQGGHSRIPCDTNFMGYSAFLAMRGNKKEGEDDIDDASVLLSISTGLADNIIFYVTGGTIILVVLAAGILLIKKFVL